MKKILSAVVMGICLSLLSAATVHANADCQFVLGFQTLRDLIGHEIVGECLENEHYNAIGDSVQQTTGGLLAWRKADNWTAFTDGYRTWVSGPNGLQQRLNTERFEWEADYAAITGQAATTALTRDALRNASYRDGRVQLQDGVLSRRPEVWRLHDLIAFGDLDNDGVDDAAVVLSYNGGGSGTFYSLLAVVNENGAPLHVASIGLGDRIRLNSLEIVAGVITVKMVAHGPNDALCCPTQETTATFRLDGNTLELLSEVPSGQLTASAQRQARPTVDPARIDSGLAAAFQRMRNAPFKEIDRLYDWFAIAGARAQFGPLEESISRFNSSSNLITINEEYRDESPEALAHALIWPLASLHAIGERGGPPRSWAECIADRTAAHSAQALWWLGNYLESGKPNPTELEQWANNNSAMYLDKSLSEWVREAYRESCASYGEPPPVPTATPIPVDTLAATIAKCSEANANDWEYKIRRSFELSGMRGDLLKKWMSQTDKYIQTAEFMCVRYQQAGRGVADVSRFASLYITSSEFRAAVFDVVYPTLNEGEVYTLSRILCTLPTHEFCRWSQKD